MFYLHLVAVDKLTAEVAVGLVQIETMITCQQTFGEQYISAYLVDVTGTTGIVACRLNTASQCLIAFETYHVVCLPAVQGYRCLL